MTVHAMLTSVGIGRSRNILGTAVAEIGHSEAVGMVRWLLCERRFTRVAFLNAHNANTAISDPEFARALQDFLVLPDGIGVDIASRLLYGSAFPANLNGTDFIPSLLAVMDEPLTVGLLGTTRKNAEQAALKLGSDAPQHRFVVIHDGFFEKREEGAILERIRKVRPDILLVAMGVPRQELWIARNMTPEHCTLPIAVGALLDFLSGSVPRAPPWVRRMRLEWVFRLVLEPHRLWRRYVLGNPVFLLRVVGQKLAGAGNPR